MNKRLLSMFLALCMIMTMLPVSAMAEETYMNNDTSGEIISFAPLTETEKKVSPGTSIEDLELPKTLTATVRTTISSESSEEEILTENLEDDLIDNSIPEDSEQDSGSLEEDAAIGDSVVATTSTAIEAEINELGEKGKATKPEYCSVLRALRVFVVSGGALGLRRGERGSLFYTEIEKQCILIRKNKNINLVQKNERSFFVK